MPFIKRSIEPVKVRQGALVGRSDVSLGEEHEVIVNHSHTQILLQLSQLANFANEIFKDLSEQCQGVINKSQRLKTRVWELEQRSKQLNVLEEKLPESTLEEVGQSVRETTPNQPRQDTGLFTSVTRPEAVQKLYLKADITPRAVYASLGPQGWKAAKKFCLTPVLKNPGETTYSITKRERLPYKITHDRKEELKPPRPRPRSAAPRPQSCAGLLDYTKQTKSTLPTPEENVLRSAKSQPSILIPIDTSISAFERFAESRASLRNLQRSTDSMGRLSRMDPRRQTFSSSSNLQRNCVSQAEVTISTEKLLEPNSVKENNSKRKNPDLYIEDSTELFARERSHSKEKRESVIKKLVRRSRSLPRNMGREKYRQMLVPPDFYDINPQRTVIVAQDGAVLNDKNETVYTNFYGAPNTELPSPRPAEKMRKSKSDHQINEKSRSKSTSAAEDMKVKMPNSRRRPRSVSAERVHTTDGEDKRFNSLSKTFAGLFGKGKKSRTLPSTTAALSKDSLNTVFTSHSEGETSKRSSKQRGSQSMNSSQITLRKRDSKATTSSSGRWSGSERLSLESDGFFSGASHLRLSRVSADRDSALGADINDNRYSVDEERLSPPDEAKSLYSVDQDGFYTTMHTDTLLTAQSRVARSPSDDLIDDDFANLSLLSSSTHTSTRTLNDQEKATPTSNQNMSLGSYPDSEQAEEISKMVASKVAAGRNINRYSLVMAPAEDDLDSEPTTSAENSPGEPTPPQNLSSNLKQSKTYESALDLVLEDLTESDAAAHSDAESVLSLRAAVQDKKAEELDKTIKSLKPQTDECILRYKQLNGCAKYQKLPLHTEKEEDNSRSCKSLPRNLKNGIDMSNLLSGLDSMGSLPRKLSSLSSKAGTETPMSTRLNVDSYRNSTGMQHNKRRSLSPGKLKSSSVAMEKPEKVHQLIAEARRMSSLSDSRASSVDVTPTKEVESPSKVVSPYASSNVIPVEEQTEHFRRQPSYKIACSNQVTPRRVLPRPLSEDIGVMKRNYSYRQANKVLRTQQSESILENVVMDSPTSPDGGLVRAPSYKMAQTVFDRGTRAPSYRRALEMGSAEVDSGVGSGDSMTSSSESNQSDVVNGRQSSYRAATENGSKTVEAPLPVLNSRLIKDCMKGVYENDEVHLSKPLAVPDSSELVTIDMTKDSKQHYSVPRIPAQPTSFNPTYVNIKVGPRSRQAVKKSLQPSKSAPQPAPESPLSVSRLSLEQGKSMTPPPRSSSRRARPLSSYIPTEKDEADVIPQNKLMLPMYNQGVFPSMEMLKREEMAVMSVLGKIKRSTRPLSYVQTDV